MAAKLAVLLATALCLQALVVDPVYSKSSQEKQKSNALQVTSSHTAVQKVGNPLTCLYSIYKIVKSVSKVKTIVEEINEIKSNLTTAEAACEEDTDSTEEESCIEEAKAAAKSSYISVLVSAVSLGVGSVTTVMGLISCISAL